MPELPTHLNNFIGNAIQADLAADKHGKIVTRFPPEPSGYLHIGHAKAICLNFLIAQQFNGKCYLRFDDTNPSKENQDFVAAIKADIKWLGFNWDADPKFTSDYFQQFYDWAITLIKKDLAYVCHLDKDQMRQYRGSLTAVGKDSPYRRRSIAENLQLLAAMQAGKIAAGTAVVRAKIDMQHPNINMRDPVIYRVITTPHHRTQTSWHLYPSYDFAHGQADAIEGVTHSLCTLEFRDHQPLYNWFLDKLDIANKPQQIEFARLQLTNILTSKRLINKLIQQNIVASWDDPRLHTLAGLRRRGYPAAAIIDFCEQIGITRKNSTIDIAQFEACIRDYLNQNSDRAMCVLNPLTVKLTNFEQFNTTTLVATNNPQQATKTTRTLAFSDEIYIEAEDFREQANKKYKRLVLDKRVRLRYGFVIEAKSVVKDETGNITQVNAEIVPDSLGKEPADGIKPKGVIHWVSAKDNYQTSVCLYNPLFLQQPNLEEDITSQINAASKLVITTAILESNLKDAAIGTVFQFERLGYFTKDIDNKQFLRTIELRDVWQK